MGIRRGKGGVVEGFRRFSEVKKCKLLRHSPLPKSLLHYPIDSCLTSVESPAAFRDTARSVWSAPSLLALIYGGGGSKSGASSTHSKRFAQFGCVSAPLPRYIRICSQAAKI